ncbi:MAG: TatD family hydrolase [Alphaproteobacteria bacterium]|nr:TatD family hydrolase [Alphaproteobacteria bacterium SS10]
MLIDSHCHLDFPDFETDGLGTVLDRAREAGVGHFLTISTRLTTVEKLAAIAAAHDDVSQTIGIHPHHVAEQGVPTVERLVELAQGPDVIGIGESGLDYYYDKSPRDQQAESFRAHCKACVEADLPLVVHARDADEDVATILKEESQGGKLRGILHCFSSGRGLAEAGLDLGFYISFSGILTFKRSEELRDLAADIPKDRLLVETDAPYLAPTPYRGKRNEPAYVVETAKVLATVMAMEPEDLARQTTENFKRLFRLDGAAA